MGTVLLVRHGLTELTGPVLAGWTPGLHLDARGTVQARRVAAQLAELPLAGLVTSPLERCTDTAGHIAAGWIGPPAAGSTRRRRPTAGAAFDPASGPGSGRRLEPVVDARIGECRYGDWTGQKLSDLAKDPLWKVVQAHPSAVTFPGPEGESLAGVQLRAVAAVREWDSRFGPDGIWVACSHGDVIKAVVADALGLHLDLFQRITIDPCSVTAIRYTDLRPFVIRVNDVGGDVSGLVPPKRRRGRAAGSDAAVGGGSGGSHGGT